MNCRTLGHKTDECEDFYAHGGTERRAMVAGEYVDETNYPRLDDKANKEKRKGSGTEITGDNIMPIS